MTPERRQEVGERLKLYKSGTPCKPQAAFAEVLRLFGETLADNDTLTAEIDRLKGEVEGWKADAERHCRNEIYYTGLLDEIAKNFGRAAYTSDDGSIQQDPLRAKMPELVATLRTRLDALVQAAEAFILAVDAHRDALDNLEMEESDDHAIKEIAANGVLLDSKRALSATVKQAKGEGIEFCIIINGKVLWHDRDVLTYDDVFRWYSMGRSFQSAVLLTVTFSNGPKENPFGSLTRGQSICVCDGLIINVTIT